MDDEFGKIIDALNLPRVVREDLKQELANQHPEPNTVSTKSMVKMSNEGKMGTVIILWEDDVVTIVSTDKDGDAHISSTNSPEMYYIAQKHYIDLGLKIDYTEENGKEIGQIKPE